MEPYKQTNGRKFKQWLAVVMIAVAIIAFIVMMCIPMHFVARIIACVVEVALVLGGIGLYQSQE